MKKNKEIKKESVSAIENLPADSFEARKKRFDDFYTWLVIMCVLMGLAAVAVAMYLEFWFGILIFIAVPFVYTAFLGDKLEKSLGLACRPTSEGVAAVVIRRTKDSADEEAWVPQNLMWYDVTELRGAKGKKPNKTVRRLYIPASLRLIEADAFADMTSLAEIRFCGSRSEWEGVECRADISSYALICADEEETVTEESGKDAVLAENENTDKA